MFPAPEAALLDPVEECPPMPSGVPLSDCRTGDEAVVESIDLPRDDTDLLDAMGLAPGVRVRLCRVGDPFILAVGRSSVGGYRIGLGRRLAEHITVSIRKAAT